MNKLKVGLHVLTKKYEVGGKEYWYEGTIMGFSPPHAKTHISLRTVQAGSVRRLVPVEDITHFKDFGKNKWRPLSELGKTTGRKLKPSGEELPSDYGE